MLCVLCLIVLWGFSLVTSYSGVIDFVSSTETKLSNHVHKAAFGHVYSSNLRASGAELLAVRYLGMYTYK